MDRPPSAHRNARKSNRPSKAKNIRSGGKWKRYRKSARLRCSGACALCVMERPGEQPREAVDVHHIERLSDRPDLAYSPHNTVPLCKECHERITTMENSGDLAGAKSIFEGWLSIIEDSDYA